MDNIDEMFRLADWLDNEIYFEVGRVGSFKTKKKDNSIILVIWGRETGRNYHVHFYRTKEEYDNRIGGGCILLHQNGFYDHGKHMDSLNKKEFNAFVKFMKSHSSENPNISNWKSIANEWDESNPEFRIPDTIKMPDYNWETVRHYKED